MDLSINTGNINTSYQYQKTENSKSNNASFASQLNETKRKFSVDDKNVSAPVYSNLGALKNTVNTSKISTDSSINEIEKRRSEIHAIQDDYDNTRKEIAKSGNVHGWYAGLNPEVMEKVLDLQIKNNKDTYYTNGNININKVAKDCGISLDNATPLELESLRSELKDEGLIDEKTADGLESFISRTQYDTFIKTGCSLDDSYNNIRINVLNEALHFKDLDSCHDANSYSREIDDMILGIVK